VLIWYTSRRLGILHQEKSGNPASHHKSKLKFFNCPWLATLQEASCAGLYPTIVSYNASAVKIYNATSSLMRFKNNFFSST
jgi:hypothetical protein